MAVVHQYLTPGEMMNAAVYLTDYAPGNGGKLTNKDYSKARSALPYARPGFVNFSAAMKACSQCGTTRTPQWREGPEGPKTLCNACGVKRVRQMRVLSEGSNKRRAPSGSAALPLKPSSVAAAAAASVAKQSSGSFTSDSAPAAALRPAVAPRKRARSPAVARRPQRKAAVKAASRTAEFATTGDWPDDEEEATFASRSAGPSLHTASGSEDSGALNSDSAEEVAWTPTRGGPAGTHHPTQQQQHNLNTISSPRLLPSLFLPPGGSAPAPPSPFPVVGHETAAAVNLLSMSIREADLAASARLAGNAAAAGGPAHRDAAGHSMQDREQTPTPMTFNSASFAAMVNAAMAGGSGVAQQQAAGPSGHAAGGSGKSCEQAAAPAERAVEALQDALRALPAARHVEMLLIKEELDNTAREAAAADAAVAAVAKILAIKQAAAIRARASATTAAKDMHRFMTGLDEEYGWSRALKKQRVHPRA